MGQRQIHPCALAVALLLTLCGCGRRDADSEPARAGAAPRIASLVPAASDLLVAMGAADHLAAVSNFEPPRSETADLPRVGDYQTTDWETLTLLRPQVLIIQLAEDRVPAGLKQRATQLGMRLVNVRIHRLEDIFTTLDQLGEAANEPQKAGMLKQRLRDQLGAVEQRRAGREPVPALIVLNAGGQAVAGPNTFLDDVLKVAGGKNVAGEFHADYPQIDGETLVRLAPRAVLQLLPGASDQVQRQAQAFWAKLPQTPAVRDGRIYTFTEADVLLPGARIGELARRFADALHPDQPPAASTHP